MSTLASDNFNRAGPELGANWTEVTEQDGSPIIVSSAYLGKGSGFCTAVYTGYGAFPNDQWCQATIKSTRTMTLVVRCGTETMEGYQLNILSGTEYKLYDCTTWLEIAGSQEEVFSDGDTIYLSAVGDQISVKVNGAHCFNSPVTNSNTPSGGYPGVGSENGFTDPLLDDWSAGDFNGGGGSAPGSIVFTITL